LKTKIIILSYYSLPGNFAASYRVQNWLDHLYNFDIYPILITRHWQKSDIDYTAINSESERTIEERDSYTIIRLPFKGSIRDKLVNVFGSKFSFLWKPISFVQLILQNYFFRLSPFSNLMNEAERILNEDLAIKVILTTGNPFLQFGFCHKLSQKFPYIKWIADYRDPWNSNSNIDSSYNLRILRLFERSREKLWTNSASIITTVSEGVASGISAITGTSTQIEIVHNGFENYYNSENTYFKDGLHFAYIGTLYPQQEIEIFLNGLKKSEPEISTQITIHFFGLNAQPEQVSRVQKYSLGLKKVVYKFYDKKTKPELFALASKCHAFLLCGIPERKGTYTAKLFDYFALQRPIILSPGDGDILDQTIQKTYTGIILNTPEQVAEFISSFNSDISYNPNKDIIDEFRTQNQVKKMAQFIHRLVSE